MTLSVQIADERMLPVRTERFTTLTQPMKHQFASWKDIMAPVLEVQRNGQQPMDGFSCRARSYDLGVMHFSSSSMDAMKYRHTMDHIQNSGIEHWCLSVLKQGADVSQSDGQLIEASSGTVQLRSYARPFEGHCSASSHAFLFLSQDNFPELCDLFDAAGNSVISGPMGELLKECILSLERHIRNMKMGEMSLVVKAVTALISAAVRPSTQSLAEAKLPIAAARFNLARKYIQENLASPTLDPASICKALAISRRQLYYIFERQNGVAKYILRRRLAACCMAIGDQSDQRLISTIAYSYGFTDPALFSRQFHAEYGFRPSDARAARLCGHVPLASSPTTFSEWLLQFRH